MSVLIVCGGELAATAMAGVAGGNMKCEMFTFFSIIEYIKTKTNQLTHY